MLDEKIDPNDLPENEEEDEEDEDEDVSYYPWTQSIALQVCDELMENTTSGDDET